MAHKTLINGATYDISGGKTLVGSTEYNIAGGKTLVDGTVYDISFEKPAPQMYYMYTYFQGLTYPYDYVVLRGNPTDTNYRGIIIKEVSRSTPPSNAIQVFIENNKLCFYWNGDKYYMYANSYGTLYGSLNEQDMTVSLDNNNMITFLNTSIATPNYVLGGYSYGDEWAYIKVKNDGKYDTYLQPIE